MGALSTTPQTQSSFPPTGPTFSLYSDEKTPEPLEHRPGTTLPMAPDLTQEDPGTTSDMQPARVFSPPSRALPATASADSTPLQIWEGTVIEVDNNSRVMRVMRVSLDSKMGAIPRHVGEIDLEWVAEQDQDLVRPGAVFYLTLFKRTKRGSVENAQELRFRRRPAWSAAQLRRVEQEAAMLLSKMKPLPLCE